ncbi:MAG TPA: hypothetical protein VK116_05115 [Planctomycetota bacterium]|nr:hypothetical protein [Planctomycetota bacterium]
MPRLPFEKHLLGSGLLFRALIAGLVAAWVCAATPALIAQAGARPDANAPPAARADGALEGDEAAANGVLGRALETGGGPQGAFPPLFTILLIAGALGSGAFLGYHPHYRGRVGSLDDIDLPKIAITYTVVGALVGFLVSTNSYLGLAIFGIGGLMRFRTVLSSAKETGRLILATMIGMIWGVGEWVTALAITAFAWLLVLVLDWHVGYRMIVRGLEGSLERTVEAYRGVLLDLGCRISQIKQNPTKGQVTFVFKATRRYSREGIQEVFEEEIPPEIRGSIDWTEEV